jgi:cellulase (glycosyl hydrolase family 5)
VSFHSGDTMHLSPRLLALLALLALAAASPATAGGDMYIGAAEDSAKSTDLIVSTAKMDLALLAGYDAVRFTATWAPGLTEPAGEDLVKLENAIGAAQLKGVRVILSVYHRNSRTTPVTPGARAAFAGFAAALARRFPYVIDFIIGNEPNLNGAPAR